jgi:hypothetical protein
MTWLARVVAVDVPHHVTQTRNRRQFIVSSNVTQRVDLDLLHWGPRFTPWLPYAAPTSAPVSQLKSPCGFRKHFRERHGEWQRSDVASEHKVPPSYSRTDDCVRSLNGRRDDVVFAWPRETILRRTSHSTHEAQRHGERSTTWTDSKVFLATAQRRRSRSFTRALNETFGLACLIVRGFRMTPGWGCRMLGRARQAGQVVATIFHCGEAEARRNHNLDRLQGFLFGYRSRSAEQILHPRVKRRCEPACIF